MSCGIYMIKNIANNKKYIGSTINFKKRFIGHKWALKNNKHFNKHLQRSYNKYGANNFEFSILEICNKDMLEIRESAFIKYYNTMDFKYGYNLVDARTNTGYKHTKETIDKIIKQKNTEESRKNMSLKMMGNKNGLGRIVSDDIKQKLSNERKGVWKLGHKFQKGHIISEESRLKMRLAKLGKVSNNKGKIFSEESRLKMRLAKLGKKSPCIGQKRSEECKLKMRLAWKIRKSKQEEVKHE